MRQVEGGADRLEAAADGLYRATKQAAEAEAVYDEAYEKELLTIYHEAKRAGDRMPAEDVRRAIAHEALDDGIYAAHLLAKAELAAGEKLMKGLLAATSARQSVLRALQ